MIKIYSISSVNIYGGSAFASQINVITCVSELIVSLLGDMDVDL